MYDSICEQVIHIVGEPSSVAEHGIVYGCACLLLILVCYALLQIVYWLMKI